jgi:ribose 5-phosphate isomerase A
MTIIDRALELLTDNTSIGLGSGRTAGAFICALGKRIKNRSIRIHGVPTSKETAALAKEVGVPLVTLDQVRSLDVTVDGADEVDPGCNLIKGYGRALVREKIVAAASRKLVILVSEEKLVPRLGTRGRLPVEVVPFGLPLCLRRFAELGFRATPYRSGDELYSSENGNNIVDLEVTPIEDPTRLEQKIKAIPGVVDTGLFLTLADLVLIGTDVGLQLVEERKRKAV